MPLKQRPRGIVTLLNNIVIIPPESSLCAVITVLDSDANFIAINMPFQHTIRGLEQLRT